MPSLDLNVNVKVPAADKLLDYVGGTFGTAWRDIVVPALAPYKASQEGKAKVTAARADAEASRIETKAKIEAWQAIANARERKRLSNVQSVVERAAGLLDGKEVSDHKPDSDWSDRFFDDAQNVSSEDLQTIWARILAGEVESPGRTSLRTLSILKDMTQEEARQFHRLMEFRIGNYLIVKFAEEVSGESLGYIILSIEEIGLFHPSMTAHVQINVSDGKPYTDEHHGYMLVIEGPPEQSLSLSPNPIETTVLTKSGMELAEFCSHEPNEAYLKHFARSVGTRKCVLKVAPIIRMANGGIGCDTRELRGL